MLEGKGEDGADMIECSPSRRTEGSEDDDEEEDGKAVEEDCVAEGIVWSISILLFPIILSLLLL